MNDNNMQKKKKTTQGRKKIEIKEIEGKSNKQVTFSKRRSGLFKKAGELCVLTGAEVSVIVTSNAGRVFAFGHPSVDAVVDRCLAGGSYKSDAIEKRYPYAHEFNQHYDRVSEELEAEKKRREAIDEREPDGAAEDRAFWWSEPVDDMGLEELEKYLASMEELKQKVEMRAEELRMMKMAAAAAGGGASSSYSNAGMNALVDHNHMVSQTAASYGNPMVPLEYDFGHGQI